MERDLSIEAAGDPMVSGVIAGSEVTVDPETEARVNAGYQKLVERVVTTGVHYSEYFPDGFSFSPDPDQLVRVRTVLDTALGTLTEREVRVLVLRNGLNGDVPKSFSETGLVLGQKPVTGERARQIETKALRKLRHPIRGLNSALGEVLGREDVVRF
ncbi:MAG: hypothetical protein KBD51_00065 [Candidatus Levybacteria bacterium]|nr:hypothetical protein [Candidatus Levybacteria bacterium]